MERNPALERAIFEAPDDLDAWDVYADWLTSIGDVRGELILLSRTRTPESFSRIAAIMDAHRDEWKRGHRAELRFGFIDKLTLEAADVADAVTLSSLLSTIPFIRTLSLSLDRQSPCEEIYDGIVTASSAHLQTLGALSLSARRELGGQDEAPLLDIHPLVKTLPIHTLTVDGGVSSPVLESETLTTLHWGRAPIPRLQMRALKSARCFGDGASLYDSISEKNLPALRSLHHMGPGPYLSALEKPEIHSQLRSLRFTVVRENAVARLQALARGTSLLIEVSEPTHASYRALRDLPNVKIAAPADWDRDDDPDDPDDDFEDGWE